MTCLRIVLTFGLTLLIFGSQSAYATTTVSAGSKNDIFERAASLGSKPEAAMLYGKLSSTGDVRYFTFTISEPQTLNIRLDEAVRPGDFEPRLVVYEPDARTVGPVLPMPQPPSTIALVYTSNVNRSFTEGPLRTRLNTRIDRSFTLTQTGRYYLAVYNAGRGAGAFRLTVSSDAEPTWSRSAHFERWWLTSIWFGLESSTLFIPFIALLAAITAWLIVRHVPAPPQKRQPTLNKKRTVTHVKRY